MGGSNSPSTKDVQKVEKLSVRNLLYLRTS